MIPRRRTRPKMMAPKEDAPIKCEPHKKWVRGHECLLAGKLEPIREGHFAHHICEGRMEAHHVKSEGSGGGDEQVVPLCSRAHATIHNIGAITFAKRFRVDLPATALALWTASPHGKRYRMQEQRRLSAASCPSSCQAGVDTHDK